MKMEKIILIMFTLILSGYSFAIEIKLDSTLKSPSVLREFGNPSVEVNQLKTLLKEGNLNEFYFSAELLYRKYLTTNGSPLKHEQLAQALWVFYYISAAPMGQQNLKHPEEEASPFIAAEYDISLKTTAFDSLINPHYIDIFKNITPHQKEFDALRFSYCAASIKQIQNVIHNGFDEKFPTETDVFGEEWGRNQGETRRQYSNMYGIAQNRNIAAKFRLKDMEIDFIKNLVESFSGRKGEVVKYIRMAGYKDNEINDLVDRTVGRDAKTEFLYKGRSKKDAR